MLINAGPNFQVFIRTEHVQSVSFNPTLREIVFRIKTGADSAAFTERFAIDELADYTRRVSNVKALLNAP